MIILLLVQIAINIALLAAMAVSITMFFTYGAIMLIICFHLPLLFFAINFVSICRIYNMIKGIKNCEPCKYYRSICLDPGFDEWCIKDRKLKPCDEYETRVWLSLFDRACRHKKKEVENEKSL